MILKQLVSTLCLATFIASSILSGCAAQPAQVNQDQYNNTTPTPKSTPIPATLESKSASTMQKSTRAELVFISGDLSVGGAQIYSCTIDSRNWTRLTHTERGGDWFPKWSPDGSKIAFHSDRDGHFQIYIMDQDGSNQTRITRNNFNDMYPSWSPDGNKITFASDRDGPLQIYIMDVSGTNQQRITNHDADDAAPAWSPDGKKIAFLSTRDGNAEIYVMDADGLNQTNLTSNAFADAYPAWSPDGQKIAYQSEVDNHFEIFVMNADGSGRTCLTMGSVDNKYPAWSPDGSKIAFYSKRDCNNDNGEIYIMDADGSNQKRVTWTDCTDTALPSWR